MFLNAVRELSLSADADPSTLTVRVEVRHNQGGLAKMTPAGAAWNYTWLRASERDLSRAGNGIVRLATTEPGLYLVKSVWRSLTYHSVYVEVVQDGEQLRATVVGQDVGDTHDTLAALEERHGIAAAQAARRARAHEASAVLADELEQGRMNVKHGGVRLEVSGLQVSELRGVSPKQVTFAQAVRAEEVRGFLSENLQRLPSRPDAREQAARELAQVLALVQDVLAKETDCRYWLDRRDGRGGQTFALELRKALRAGTLPAAREGVQLTLVWNGEAP